MSGSEVVYYEGGYIAAAPAKNQAEMYDGAAGTYTAWDRQGAIVTSRALSSAEQARLATQDAASTAIGNADILRQRAQQAKTRIAGIRTQMGTITGTSGTLTTAQLSNAARALAAAVDDLARIDASLIRLAVQDFSDVADST